MHILVFPQTPMVKEQHILLGFSRAPQAQLPELTSLQVLTACKEFFDLQKFQAHDTKEPFTQIISHQGVTPSHYGLPTDVFIIVC